MSATTSAAAVPTPPYWLPLDTEMGQRIATFDWASTPLGPIEEWPEPLRNAVSTCVSSRFPLLVLWGPDLVKIYNDGYAEMVGPSKHPRALGAPAREIWTEIWDVIGPMFDTVVTTGVATWSEHETLLIDRRGFTEECFFHWSYSPIYGDGGAIVGILDISVETTNENLTTRRLACLNDLSAAVSTRDRPTDVCVAAVRALGRHRRDIAVADIVLNVDGQMVPVASSRRSLSAVRDINAMMPRALAGESVTIGQECDGLPAEHHIEPFRIAGGVSGALVASLNPLRPFDDDFRRFVSTVAQTVGSAVERARQRAETVGELQLVNQTLQQAMLPAVSDSPTIAARYLPAADDLSVGGDWYDIVDLPGDRRGLVVGDCVGHGLHAATAMGQLRSAARALLLEGHDPAHLLTSLDVFAQSVEGGVCASVACVVVDRRARRLTFCRAGHPPPLLVHQDCSEWLEGHRGPVLGVDSGGVRANTTVPFGVDDVLVMYTDGLVERRRSPLQVQLDELSDIVQQRVDRTASDVANAVLQHLVDDAVDDDIVVLVKRLDPVD